MPATEAQIAANQRNAQLSSGPRTDEGKARSRRNALKHGMAGAGVVVPESEAEAVARRAEELSAEMAPRTSMGVVLVGQIASLSVRVERSFRRDTAETSHRVRHAGETFDDTRFDEAEALLEAIGEAPRKALRKLKRTPEGVEAMIEVWQELRADLTRERRPIWTQAHRERAENLTGRKIDYAHGSEINAISKTIWGDPGPKIVEDEHEPAERAAEAIRARGRSEMVAFIDRQIADLEAHYETLDFDAIEADRAGAPDRALFDPSKEATLARRYESEALRNFHKALKEFRRVEAEAPERPKPVATPPAVETRDPLGSSREIDPSAGWGGSSGSEGSRFDPIPAADGVARTGDGRVVTITRRDPASV